MLLKILAQYTKPYRGTIWLIVVLQALATIANLLLPSINADIIDKGIVVGDTPYILRQGGVMLIVSLVQVACTIVAVYYGSRVAMAFGRDLRSGIFGRVAEFSNREVAQFGAPSLLTRSTNDVQQVQMLLFMTFSMLVTTPIMMLGGIFMALREDVGLSWLVAVAVPLLAGAVGFIIWRAVPGFRQMQTRIDRVNQVMREQVMAAKRGKPVDPRPLEELREQNIEGAAIRVVGWSGVKQEFSADLMRQALRRNPHWVDQIVRESDDLGNFTGKRSAK